MKYNGERICPKCKQQIFGHPAISRIDNKTEICSDCGVREALEALHKHLESQKK